MWGTFWGTGVIATPAVGVGAVIVGVSVIRAVGVGTAAVVVAVEVASSLPTQAAIDAATNIIKPMKRASFHLDLLFTCFILYHIDTW
ncbi:MAG: hypothetical protein A2Y60_03110 [Chloroflexi bacterium RBG_13_54_9]|nr:MAG: hypothetical protein A2Y60_03110 [Chloroflexi bacterium RBG_13_54_9]